MKKLLFLLFTVCVLWSCGEPQPASLENAQHEISRVEPLSWWTDMQTPLT